MLVVVVVDVLNNNFAFFCLFLNAFFKNFLLFRILLFCTTFLRLPDGCARLVNSSSSVALSDETSSESSFLFALGSVVAFEFDFLVVVFSFESSSSSSRLLLLLDELSFSLFFFVNKSSSCFFNFFAFRFSSSSSSSSNLTLSVVIGTASTLSSVVVACGLSLFVVDSADVVEVVA